MKRFVQKQFYVTGEENVKLRAYAKRLGVSQQQILHTAVMNILEQVGTQ